MSSYTRQQLENWLKTIDVKGSVLDVGGSQNPIKGRTKSWDVTDYKILDLEQPHECRQKPEIIGDIQDIVEYWEEEDKYSLPQGYNKYKKAFNIVFCIEVSEYWYNPFHALNNIRQFLKKDGLLYISFHFIYPQHNPRGLDYLRYTPAGAEKLLKESRFKILQHIYRSVRLVNLREIWTAEQMRGWKNFENSGYVIGSLIKARKM